MSRIALVTGANKGLGLETARQLAQEGMTVLMSARNREKGLEAVQKLKDEELDVELVQLEVTNEAEVDALIAKIDVTYGKLDVLVNNAGIMHSGEPTGVNTAEIVKAEVLKETFDVNFFSLVRLTQKMLPLLRKSDAGRIINVTSRAAYKGETAEYFAYGASKAGMVSLTRSIAKSYGKQGIKAFNIAPGFVRTDMAKEFMQQYGEEHAKGDLALERLTEPKDLAPLITFIASGMADHATGATFDVNAGSFLH